MQTIHLSTFIVAPREHVWDVMLSDKTYREWTGVFMPGSCFRGSWEQGSKILFVAPNQDGVGESGMVSRIAESRRPEFVSINHQGMIFNGVEDTTSDKVKPWAGSYENYTFEEKDGGTQLTIDMSIVEEEKATMEEAWKKALVRLKELAEQG